jgi:hypothetical protein
MITIQEAVDTDTTYYVVVMKDTRNVEDNVLMSDDTFHPCRFATTHGHEGRVEEPERIAVFSKYADARKRAIRAYKKLRDRDMQTVNIYACNLVTSRKMDVSSRVSTVNPSDIA